MAEAKGVGPAKAKLPAEPVEQGRFGPWSAAGRLCGIPVQPWRWTTPWGRQRDYQRRQVGCRPGGGLCVLRRCLRILITCAGSMMTAMIFMGL